MKKLFARIYLFLVDPMDIDLKAMFSIMLLFIALSLIYITCDGQTITKIYAKSGLNNYKVRIDGAQPTQLLPADIYFCGGGFTFQIWNVCNMLSTMSVSNNRVSCKVGYPTSFPSDAAANKGIEYAMKAVAYIKLHAKEYGIDTNKIYLWGTSAGGFCSMGVYQHKVKVEGAVNMWGGILQLSYLTQNNIPVFNVSTEYDPTVPLGCDKAFGVSCCGSEAITNELTRLGIKTDWLQFQSQKHGVKDLQSVTKIFNEALIFFKLP